MSKAEKEKLFLIKPCGMRNKFILDVDAMDVGVDELRFIGDKAYELFKHFDRIVFTKGMETEKQVFIKKVIK